LRSILVHNSGQETVKSLSLTICSRGIAGMFFYFAPRIEILRVHQRAVVFFCTGSRTNDCWLASESRLALCLPPLRQETRIKCGCKSCNPITVHNYDELLDWYDSGPAPISKGSPFAMLSKSTLRGFLRHVAYTTLTN
jgi:hypothetical protein